MNTDNLRTFLQDGIWFSPLSLLCWLVKAWRTVLVFNFLSRWRFAPSLSQSQRTRHPKVVGSYDFWYWFRTLIMTDERLYDSQARGLNASIGSRKSRQKRDSASGTLSDTNAIVLFIVFTFRFCSHVAIWGFIQVPLAKFTHFYFTIALLVFLLINWLNLHWIRTTW